MRRMNAAVQRRYAAATVGSKLVFRGKEGFALVDRFGRPLSHTEADALRLTSWRWRFWVKLVTRSLHATDLEKVFEEEWQTQNSVPLEAVGRIFENWVQMQLLSVHGKFELDRINYTATILGR